MNYPKIKVYFDGSHYIGIPHITQKWKKKKVITKQTNIEEIKKIKEKVRCIKITFCGGRAESIEHGDNYNRRNKACKKRGCTEFQHNGENRLVLFFFLVFADVLRKDEQEEVEYAENANHIRYVEVYDYRISKCKEIERSLFTLDDIFNAEGDKRQGNKSVKPHCIVIVSEVKAAEGVNERKYAYGYILNFKLVLEKYRERSRNQGRLNRDYQEHCAVDI